MKTSKKILENIFIIVFYIYKTQEGIFLDIISVNITKGGCGKTTTVQALAELAGSSGNKRVLCIDTDPQCNLTTASGIDIMDCKDKNLYTLLSGHCTADQCIIKTKYYDLIPGSIKLASADREFTDLGRESILKEQISSLDYDLILIDTPPALGILNIMSLTASTKVIIPTECSYLAMMGLEQLSETIDAVKKHTNTNLSIAGILLIKYNSRTNINDVVIGGLEDMAKSMDTDLYSTKIRETVKIREAQSQQEPLIDWDKSCTAILDYNDFYKEVFS